MSDRDTLRTPTGSVSKSSGWLKRVRASSAGTSTSDEIVSTAYNDLPRADHSPVVAIRTHRERDFHATSGKLSISAPLHHPSSSTTRDDRTSSGTHLSTHNTFPPESHAAQLRSNSLQGPRPLPNNHVNSSAASIAPHDSVSRASSINGSVHQARQSRPTGHRSRQSDAQSIQSYNSDRMSFVSTDSRAPFTTQNLYKFGPNGEFPQPKSTAEIERMFTEMMSARDLFRQMPDDSRRQLLTKPLSVKWQMIYADAMTVWRDQVSRRNSEAQGNGSKGSPDWYVKRIVDQTLKPAQYTALNVCLRTLQVSWVREFIENQGHIALATALSQINQRTSKRDDDIVKEQEILKCLKVILNNQYGAEETMSHQRCIDAITISLISPNMASRKLVVDILSFFCAWKDPTTSRNIGHEKVLQAFERLKDITNTATRFESWMHVVETTIDGRGIAGSRVGASDELKSAGAGRDATLMEYALSSSMLVNQIALNAESLQTRIHIRTQLKLCGWLRIAAKLSAMGFDLIQRQLIRYAEQEEQDLAELAEYDDNADIQDIDNPVELVQGIWNRLDTSRARDYFLSTLQHLLLVREQDDDRTRLFQLIDSVMTHIVMDSSSSKRDFTSAIGSSLREVMARLATDEEARNAIEEAREAQHRIETLATERHMMQKQISLGANGLVQQLKDELAEQQMVLSASQRQCNELKQQIQGLRDEHRAIMHKTEIETRELYMMLREGGNNDWEERHGVLDRKVLMDRLERQLERKKTEFKLEGRVWGDHRSQPDARLRHLRNQMENLELDARRLQLDNAPSSDEEEQEDGISSLSFDRHKSQFGSARSRIRSGHGSKLIQVTSASAASDESRHAEGHTDVDENDAQIVREKPRIIQFKKPLPIRPGETPTNKFEGLDKQVSPSNTSPSSTLVVPSTERVDDEVSDRATTKVRRSDKPESLSPDSLAPDTSINGFTTEGKIVPDPATPISSLAPPPPPPPLPMISAAGFSPPSAAGTISAAPPPPPPPPPMPSVVPGSGTSAPGGPPPPPPPPPPPGQMPGIKSAMKGPPPPPLPGVPTIKVSTDLNASSDLTAPETDIVHAGPLGKTGLPFVAAGHKQLAKVRPQKKMKQMHFDKLDTGPQYTLWAESKLDANALYTSLSDRGLLEEIDKSYAMREVKLNLGKRGKKRDKKTFLTNDVQQRIGVSFHRFNSLTIQDLVAKLLRCEDDMYTPELIDFLADEKLQNQDQAKKSLRPYSANYLENGNRVDPDKDPEELMREDQIFLATFVELGHYWHRRMGGLKLRDNLERNYKELQGQISTITNTSLALRNSQSFREVLNVVLHLGNYMNDIGKQAEGFKLGTLARLPLTKNDKNTKQTFMHTLERVIRTVYPQLEEFLDDLKDVGIASKIDISSLSAEVKQLITQSKATQRALDTGDMADKKLLHPKDRIRTVLESYLPTAVRKTNFLSTLLEDMELSLGNCMIYYCEEPKDSTSRSQFFQKFDFFLKEYRRVKKENFDSEEEAHRAEIRRKALLKAGQKNILDQAMNQTPNHAVMDNLLEKLRVGPDPEARRIRKKTLPVRRTPASTLLRKVSEERSSIELSSANMPSTPVGMDSIQEKLDIETTEQPSTPDQEPSSPAANAGNNAVLAARAQSMLAGLRSGKVIKRDSTEPRSPPKVSTISPVRLALSSPRPRSRGMSLILNQQNQRAESPASPTPDEIKRPEEVLPALVTVGSDLEWDHTEEGKAPEPQADM